jgi:hypothetical protein
MTKTVESGPGICKMLFLGFHFHVPEKFGFRFSTTVKVPNGLVLLDQAMRWSSGQALSPPILHEKGA